MICLILVLILTICLLAFVIYYFKKSLKKNLLFAKRNMQTQRILQALEQDQERNSNLMKMVAHDLRNPIGGMTMSASILLAEPGISDEHRILLELILTSGQHSLELVDDLLKVNTMIRESDKGLIDLHTLLKYCVELMAFKAAQKMQAIKLQSTHIIISVNREKMWRVMSNLISNAVKFSPENSLIHIGMKDHGDHVIISVQDCGIGIPAHLKERIFDLFTTSRREGTSGEEAFGLGLAISKQIVEAHGGKIWFSSVPNEGTTFYVELPVIHRK
jgi:signal transduction histidine kinase